MPSITLKSLPAPLHRALKARAARHHRSLNQEVIAVLAGAVAPSQRLEVEAIIEEARRFRAGLQFSASPEEIDAYKRAGRP